MSAGFTSMAFSAAQGAFDGQRLVATIRDGMAPADALLEGIQQVQATGDAHRLAALLRAVQKALEGRA